jgi:hypothetical protein
MKSGRSPSESDTESKEPSSPEVDSSGDQVRSPDKVVVPVTLAASLKKVQRQQLLMKKMEEDVREMLEEAQKASSPRKLDEVEEKFMEWREVHDLLIVGEEGEKKVISDLSEESMEIQLSESVEKLILQLDKTIEKNRAEEKQNPNPYREKLAPEAFNPATIDADLRKGIGITVTAKMSENEKYIRALRQIVPIMTPEQRVALANHLVNDKTHPLQKHRYQSGSSTETLNMGIAQGILARGLDEGYTNQLTFNYKRSHVKKAYQEEFNRVDQLGNILSIPRPKK